MLISLLATWKSKKSAENDCLHFTSSLPMPAWICLYLQDDRRNCLNYSSHVSNHLWWPWKIEWIHDMNGKLFELFKSPLAHKFYMQVNFIVSYAQVKLLNGVFLLKWRSNCNLEVSSFRNRSMWAKSLLKLF